MSLKEKVTGTPALGTLEALMTECKPKTTEIVVVVEKRLLLFKAFGSITDWDNLKKDAQKWAVRLGKNKVGAQVTTGNYGYDASCWVLAQTMVGSFMEFDEPEPGKYKGIGEIEPAWTYAQWLELARVISGTTFENISRQVDAQQTESARAEFLGTVQREGED